MESGIGIEGWETDAERLEEERRNHRQKKEEMKNLRKRGQERPKERS